MSNLTILNSSIRQLDGLYSLNDLHKIYGNEDKHLPVSFYALKQNLKLIAKFNRFKTCRSGVQNPKGRGIQGAYACKEIAHCLCSVDQPQFHLVGIAGISEQAGKPNNTT